MVFSEFKGSVFDDVNTESYLFWKANGWWMAPWHGKLPSDLASEQGS